MKTIRKNLNDYNDLADNAFEIMKDRFTFESILWMPIRGLIAWTHYYIPKAKKIANAQAKDKMEAELMNKKKLPTALRNQRRM